MSLVSDIQRRLHRRKHNREVHRRKHQRRRMLREMRAIQRLRARIDALRSFPHVMFDDTNVALIPKGAKAAAGYVNGIYTTFPALVRRFSKARLVSIAVSSSVDAHVLDVEPGDATNADASGWFHRHNHRKFGRAIFYTSASNVSALVATLSAAGIRRHQYKIWSAHYNGSRHICSPRTCGYPEAESTQWTDTSNHRSLDESKVSRAFWVGFKALR